MMKKHYTPEELRAMGERLRTLGQQVQDAVNPRTDYQGQDLRGRSFAHEKLSNVYFREANLTGVSFQGAQLAHSNGNRAILNTADFREARIVKSDFVHAQLEGAAFTHAYLLRVTFDEGNLTRAQFTDATLYGVSLWGAHMQESDFRRSVLHMTAFNRASLAGADFTGARFDDVYMAGAQGLDQVRADWLLVGDEVFNERLEGDAAHAYLRQCTQYSTAAAVRWREAGQAWRYAPELAPRFQAQLAERMAQQPIKPFAGMRLTRAALEWLVAVTPASARVDVREAQLDSADLTGTITDRLML